MVSIFNKWQDYYERLKGDKGANIKAKSKEAVAANKPPKTGKTYKIELIIKKPLKPEKVYPDKARQAKAKVDKQAKKGS
jgi:hypothetical protein